MGIAAPSRTRSASRPAAAPKPRMMRIDKDALRMLLDQAPDAILVYDLDRDRIIDGNRNAETLFECSHAELLRSAPRRFYADDPLHGEAAEESHRPYERRAWAGE